MNVFCINEVEELYMEILLRSMFSWINLPYTILLLILLIYWVTVIIGLMDIEMFDFDLESEGFFGGILNLGMVPFSIWASIFVFQAWLYSLIANSLLAGIPNFPITGFFRFIIVGSVIVPLAAFITKLATLPFKKLFSEQSIKKNDFVTQECEVTSTTVNTKFGTGEVRIDGDVQILDIRAKDEEGIQRGEKVLICDYDKEEDLFWVTRI